jgi:hypothetical protein
VRRSRRSTSISTCWSGTTRGPSALLFNLRTDDWSASRWPCPTATLEDLVALTHDLDRLAAKTLDYWLGTIQRTTETFIHIRRDRFVFDVANQVEA